MAFVTIYDDDIAYWRDALETADDVDSVIRARDKLLSLVKDKWNFVFDLGDLSTEIDERFNSNDESNGISKVAYLRWKEVLNHGIDDDSIAAARTLLLVSDQTRVSNMVDKRVSYLTRYDNDEEDEDDNEESSEPSSDDTTQTVTQRPDGRYVLTEPEDISEEQTAAVSKQNEQDPTKLDRRPMWTDTNIEYHRTKTSAGFAVDSAYIKRYYSVIDAEVYFGNEYVEDVHDIDWAIQQQVMPLFGYNSYTYDEVARGNRIIVGSFTINFTSPNYLFSLLEAADKANVTAVSGMTNYNVPKLDDSVEPVFKGSTYGTRERGHHSNIWPQTFDIDVIFGEKTGAGNPVHIMILSCALQSCRTVLSASVAGSPPDIKEQYSFLAQDIRTIVVSTEEDRIGGVDQTTSNNGGNDDAAANVDNDTTRQVITADEVTEENDNKTNNDSDDEQQSNGTLKGNTTATEKEDDRINAENKQKIAKAAAAGQRLAHDNESNVDIIIDSSGSNKLVSDAEACVLLARFSKQFNDIDNLLTQTDQRKLARKILDIFSKGEYFVLDGNTLHGTSTMFRYTVEHNGEVKVCTTIIKNVDDVIAQLEKGIYKQEI